jgi:hypothetical protein
VDEKPNNLMKNALKYGGIVVAILVPVMLLVLFLAVFYNPSGLWGRPSGSALAADVSCELKFPIGAASDDIIGAVYDRYIKEFSPKSPLIGMGKYFAQSGRKSGINPNVIMANARKESNFAVAGGAKVEPPCYNPFGRKGSGDCGDSKEFMKFSSYEDAILQHGDYIVRVYVKEGKNNIAEMMEKYCPRSDNCATDQYIKEMREWNADLINMAGGALGTGICLANIAKPIPPDKGICPNSLCTQKPLPITAEMNQEYGYPVVIILHYLGTGLTAQGAYDYFKTTVTNKNPSDNKFVQFVVGKDGTIYQLAAESKMVAGALNYNKTPDGGITISIENEGHFESSNSQEHETAAEVASNVKLVKYLMQKYNINKDQVISHKEADQRAGNAEGRRSDPGERFMQKVLNQL